jgi:hypothetical protein
MKSEIVKAAIKEQLHLFEGSTFEVTLKGNFWMMMMTLSSVIYKRETL